MLFSEPGASPCGSWLQAGPNTSALVVTPLDAAADAEADAGADMGAEDAVVEPEPEPPPHAARVTVSAAIAPAAASRKGFFIGFSSAFGPARPGLSSNFRDKGAGRFTETSASNSPPIRFDSDQVTSAQVVRRLRTQETQ